MIEWIISSSALILAVIFLRFMFKDRISMRFRYGLWIIVLLRLLIPSSFSNSVLSVMNIAQQMPFVQTMQQLQGGREVEYTDRGNVEGYYKKDFMRDVPILIAEEVNAKEFAGMKRMVAALSVLEFAWYCGMLIVAIVILRSNLTFMEKVKGNRRKIEYNLSKVPLYVTDMVDSPCLFGVIRPAIYIPEDLESDETAMQYILAHELTHYYHGDHIWSVLRCACLILHWYNPLVWEAVRMSRWDAELACDEGTVKRIGESKRGAYGRILIRLTVEGAEKENRLLAATTMAGDVEKMKERLILLTKSSSKRAVSILLLGLIALLVAACTFTGAEEGSVDIGEPGVVEQGEQKEQEETIPIFLDLNSGASDAAIEYAMDYVRRNAENFNRMWEEHNFDLRAIEGVGSLTEVETGTAAENFRIEMYSVSFKLRLEGDADQYLGGNMKVEKVDEIYWLNSFSNTDVIYLFLSCEDTKNGEVWTKLGMVNEEDLEWYYNTEEMLDKYGNMYTAAAMEIYYAANGISFADLARDGVHERIQSLDTGDGMLYELRVQKADGSLLWSETAHTAHTGWNSLFLCEVDGEDYLL